MSGRRLGQRITCPTCHRQFTRALGTNRLYCFDCRPARSKVLELPREDDGPTLVSLSREALAEVGADRTWQGMAAIRLAELIDSKRHGASGAAGNVRAHRDAMSFALADVGAVADVIDLVFREPDPRVTNDRP